MGRLHLTTRIALPVPARLRAVNRGHAAALESLAHLIRAVEASSGAVMNLLIDGSVDIAIVVHAGSGARVELTERLTEPICLVCARVAR